MASHMYVAEYEAEHVLAETRAETSMNDFEEDLLKKVPLFSVSSCVDVHNKSTPTENYEIKYKGEEIVKRRGEEVLVKWVEVSESEPQPTDSNHVPTEDILLWMTDREVSTCCPQLQVSNECVTDMSTGGTTTQHSVVSDSGNENDEMIGDITDLIERAQRFNVKVKEAPHPSNERLLSNTVSILSAYAKIGSLADTFKQESVICLLLNLLSSSVSSVRHSASEMLRSLAIHDSACRSHILLTLSSSSHVNEASAEDRQVLLDLFYETTLDEERKKIHNIFIPQVSFTMCLYFILR